MRAVSAKLTFTFVADLDASNLQIDDKSVVGRTFCNTAFQQSVAVTYADGRVRHDDDCDLDDCDLMVGISGDEVKAINRRFAEAILPLVGTEDA